MVPDLEEMIHRWNGVVVIGLSGPIAAGKTTAGMYLRALGCHYARYSMVVEQVAREAGREISHSTLQEVGRELHQTRGQRWLGERLLDILPKSGCLAIDGLRYPDDHAFLSGSFGPSFHHIAISSPLELRQQRFTQSHPGENYLRALTHSSELGVQTVIQLAHRVIVNDGSKTQFLATLESAVRELLDESRTSSGF